MTATLHPIERADDFDHEPPPTPSARWAGVHMAEAYMHARHAAEDLGDALDAMPDAAPLLSIADLVTAQRHLSAARRLIDNAATSISGADQ